MLMLLGGLVLIGLLVVGGIVLWVSTHADEIRAKAAAVAAEAEEFAETHEQRECVDEGFRRTLTCRVSIECETTSLLFTEHCMESAAPSVPHPCDGVPSKTSILGTIGYAREECARRGKSNSEVCQRFFSNFVQSCDRHRRRPPAAQP